MLAFNEFILGVICVLFPLLCYLFYLIYKNDIGKNESNLMLILALVSSLYLTLEFGVVSINNVNFLLLNIPIVVAYIKKKPIIGIALSVIIIEYYYQYPQVFYLVIVEYIIYYLLYVVFKKENLLINSIVLIRGFFLSLQIFSVCNLNDKFVLLVIFFLILNFYILNYLVLFLFKKAEELSNVHMSIKNLEKEKKIRDSLFKITHEIKNPIAVCKGYIDMFDYNDEVKIRKYISIIKEELDRTLDIMNDFMSFTKININTEKVDIGLLLDDVVDNMKILINSININLKTNILDSIVYIDGDYNRLKQVFINIIKNSLEAIEGYGTIEITSTIIKNNYVVIIKDDGIGIKPELLEKIKEPFYSTKEKGTGLGVSLSNEIISSHKGKLVYESTYNKGTTVNIVLPIKKD